MKANNNNNNNKKCIEERNGEQKKFQKRQSLKLKIKTNDVFITSAKKEKE